MVSHPGLAGRVAVVTGAGGGIGQAVALALAAEGATVAAADVSEPGLKSLMAEAPDPTAIVPRVVDVRAAPAIESLVSGVERDIGPIDLLVNCAGILCADTALDTAEEDWVQTLDVNAGGVFRMSTAVARRMVVRRRGAIVTVASNAASVPRLHMASYCASKAAAVAFTKTLGLELAPSGIRCNVVAPGSTETTMLRALWTDDSGPAHSLDGDLAEYRVGIPLRKFAQPQDISDAVLFLLSDRAAHITMQDLYVDGGAALGR